jgi:hypothetical protein
VSFGEEPYCEKIQMLPSDPVIDGQVDAGLPLQFVQPMAFRVHADNPDPYKTFPPGVTLDVAVAWRPNGLYFFFRIVDPDYNPAPDGQAEWGGDGAEIYVDHDAVFAPAGAYDDPGTNSFIFEGPPDDADVGGASGRYIPYTRVGDFGGQWLSQKTVDGYVVEAFIAAADLGLADWSIGAGSSLAFDVGHNVSFPPGTTSPDFNRLGQYFLRAADPLAGVEADYPFFNSALFCVPEVSAD